MLGAEWPNVLKVVHHLLVPCPSVPLFVLAVDKVACVWFGRVGGAHGDGPTHVRCTHQHTLTRQSHLASTES